MPDRAIRKRQKAFEYSTYSAEKTGMASHDRKQLILEIVKSAGTLDAAGIKVRVCEREAIPLDKYPKSTYQRHLRELVKEGKLLRFNGTEDLAYDENKKQVDDDEDDDVGGKFLYKLSYDGTDVIGHNYLQKLGGSIYVPKVVQTFGVKILQGIVSAESKNEIYLVLEVSQNYFTLCVSKDALPFNIHVSRTQHDPEKPEKVIDAHGVRTITLELDHPRVSSFKDEDPRRTGHVLMSFVSEEEVILEDLGSSNGTEVKALTVEATSMMVKKANRNPLLTSRESYIDDSKAKPVTLQPFKEVKAPLPQLAICSGSLNIVIFSPPSKHKSA